MAPTPRRRAANGRFAADAPADLGAIRADYEAGVLSITDLCIRHSISASAVHRLVVTHGWKPRAPHRIDPGDLIMRMFALLDALNRYTIWSGLVFHCSLNAAWGVFDLSGASGGWDWTNNLLRLACAAAAVVLLWRCREARQEPSKPVAAEAA